MVAQAEVMKTPVSADTMLPDLLAAYPQARRVFDQYGLSGCGGALGPVESVGFFARTHGVDELRLLSELREAINRPAAPEELTTPAPSLADTIYRRFFIGGIVLILTAGATWGAWLLWQIGFAGKFTGISIHHVNAHGHAQIYGWVGLFIMGFAYQAFPRIWHTTLAAPRLAALAFGLMAVGLIIRTIGMTFPNAGALALWGALGGAALEALAIVLFIGQVLATFRKSNHKLEPYVGFVLMALFWFVAMAGLDVWHTYKTMTATTRQDLLWYVATYQAPLRDLQIHGLAMFMILGVSLRMLPPLFGLPKVSDRRAWHALWVLSVAVLGQTLLFIAYRFSGNHALAGLLMVPWLMLAIGVAMLVWPWKLWRPFPEGDRSAKFVRVAYGWLAVSLVMLLLLPVYQMASQIPFSHAYYGAIRHAITVGFISLMIMGFAAKVVPTLNGLDTRKLSALWGPFVLINVGCFLRVSLQTLTDWHPGFFFVVGISGTLEVAALAWWGAGLIGIMRRGKTAEAALEQARAPRPQRIEPETIVADVLGWFPDTMRVFEQHGFTLLRNPIARRILARSVSISRAAALRGVPLDALLDQLNRAIERPASACNSAARGPEPLVQLTVGAAR